MSAAVVELPWGQLVELYCPKDGAPVERMPEHHAFRCTHCGATDLGHWRAPSAFSWNWKTVTA